MVPVRRPRINPKDFSCNALQENFACLLESNAHCFGDKTALVWEDGSLTWMELEQRASGFAHSLAEQGVRSGDRVALLIPNRWTFLVALLGILKLGATAAPLTPVLHREELADILGDLRAKLVIDWVDEVKVEKEIWVTPRLTSSPALIVYTSGSTGRPKGAVFSHMALAFANRFLGGIGHGPHPPGRGPGSPAI